MTTSLLPRISDDLPTRVGMIPTLNGLRAVAVLIVFASHLPTVSSIPGGFGVSIFFVLSGYLITTLLMSEYRDAGRIDLKYFAIRRAVRILPPVYIVLIAGVVLVWLGLLNAPNGLSGTWWQLLQVSNYYFISGGDSIVDGSIVTWSLSVEEHFYLVFPAGFLLVQRLPAARTRVAALVLVCLLVLSWRMWLAVGISSEEAVRIFYGTDTRIDSILWGCVLALGWNPVSPSRKPSQSGPGARLKSEMVVLAFCLFLVFTITWRDVYLRETIRYTVQAMALAGLYGYVIPRPDLFAHRVLDSKPFEFLGKISYPFYLIHFVVIEAVFARVDGVVALVLSFGVSIGISVLLERIVDRPLAGLRARFRHA